MGIADFFSDVVASLPWPQEAHAEAAADEDKEEEESSEGGESEEKSDEGGEGGEGEEGGDEEGAEEEEEEEEEEIEDPKPKIEAECARSNQCIGYKHHYDACVERVTAQQEDEDYKGPKEDCVEEFFHLQHCATQCAAPRLFRILK